MNRILNYFILMFLTSATLRSQTQAIPTFETTIWFEDAVGNRDSIIVGSDPLVNDQYNPDFGETDIKTPFDSIFEVRATHRLSYHRRQYILSKKVVARMDDPSNPSVCPFADAVCFVKAKYQPVKVSWDQPLLADNTCFDASFVTPNLRWELVLPFDLDWNSIRAKCMTRNSDYELYLDTKHIPSNEVPYLIKHPRANGMEDSITGVVIAIGRGLWLYPLCRIASSSESLLGLGYSHLSPNPTSETVTVGVKGEPGAQLVQVFNMEGRLLMETTASSDNAPVSLAVADFPPGVYAVVEHLEHGKRRFGRFIKL